MSASILDGKALAKQLQSELAEEVADFVQNNATVPKLSAVLVGQDPASEVYVRNKRRACERVGMESELHNMPADSTEDDVLGMIAKLNKDRTVHGILVQLPLPSHIPSDRILRAVQPAKDVDAFHPENVGLLVQGRPRFLPCTPNGIVQLLKRNNIPISGKQVAVLGRSDIVGKPISIMLASKSDYGNATVTLCHSRTENLPEVTRQADILIAAIGKPNFVTAEMVKPGACVIDVGINRTEAGLVGDVDFAAVSAVAGSITPVPGGVGPLTVTMLLYNTLTAARHLET